MTEQEYRYAEKVLYSYRRDNEKVSILAAEIEILREAGDVRVQSYNGSVGNVQGISDPVASHVEKVMSLERRLKRVLRRVKAVDQMREDLQNDRVITITSKRNLLLILDGYYIPCLTVNEFLTAFCWSRSIFYVRRRELVMIAGEYLRA